MTNILDTFSKMLRNEADLEFKDQCVQGGFRNFQPAWEANARKDGVPEELNQRVLEWLRSYRSMEPEERARSLQELLRDIGSTAIQPVSVPAMPLVKSATPEAPASPSQPVPQEAPPAPVAISTASAPPRSQAPAPATPPEKPTDLSPITLKELSAPVTRLPGVGAKHADSMQRLGLKTIGDLLWHLPRRYVDYSTLKPINRLWYGETVTVLASVQEIATRRTRKGSVTEMTVSDGSGSILVSFFNQPWIETRLRKGQLLALSGKVGQYLGRLTMSMPEWEFLDRQQIRTGSIVPIYRLTAGVNQNFLRHQIHGAVSHFAGRLPDPLPSRLLEADQWMPLSDALQNIHFPSSWESQKAAKDRLGFEELLYLQLGILRQRRDWTAVESARYEKPPALETWIDVLPYTLTSAQQKAVCEIQTDLASGRPMNRLLEGDVGSGKTIVALIACLTVALQGGQAAILAPTGILAEQHYQLFERLAAGGEKPLRPDQIALLTGATPESEKQQIREGLADGRIALVVGTHALIEAPVTFAKLDLAVIDEQHRFGVEQRAALRAKGEGGGRKTNPHLLVMTATPIPRSLALTIYGDLDLSVLDELPPGRRPVTTRILLPAERERAYSFLTGQFQKNRQAFIICPRIEEGETGETAAAVEEHKRLQEQIFPKWNLGLLHGRMRAEEKEEVMRQFRAGELHGLVSTSVVEVGVDIPNATVMMVEGATRFGLAQLHQFRGRVGRGEYDSYCILMAESDDAAENERLRAMEETQDGFALAEKDMQQRGPGEFFGNRQSGFANSDILRLLDVHLIEKARTAAKAIFAEDPELSSGEHRLIAERLAALWRTGHGEVS